MLQQSERFDVMVRGIWWRVQVLNLGATGPVFYYFSKPPVYDHPIIWKEEHDNVAIQAFDNEVRLS
jgi:hypothetical protein